MKTKVLKLFEFPKLLLILGNIRTTMILLILICNIRGATQDSYINLSPTTVGAIEMANLDSLYNNFEVLEIPCFDSTWINFNNPHSIIHIIENMDTLDFMYNYSIPQEGEQLPQLRYTYNSTASFSISQDEFSMTYVENELVYRYKELSRDSCKIVLVKYEDEPCDPVQDPNCDCNQVFLRMGAAIEYQLFQEYKTFILSTNPNPIPNDEQIEGDLIGELLLLLQEAAQFWSMRLDRNPDVFINVQVIEIQKAPSSYRTSSINSKAQAMRGRFGSTLSCLDLNSSFLFIKDYSNITAEGAGISGDFCARKTGQSNTVTHPTGFVKVDPENINQFDNGICSGSGFSYSNLQVTVFHEVGHMFGAIHESNALDIMYATGPSSRCSDQIESGSYLSAMQTKLKSECSCMLPTDLPDCEACELIKAEISGPVTQLDCEGSDEVMLAITVTPCVDRNDFVLKVILQKDANNEPYFEINDSEPLDFINEIKINNPLFDPYHIITEKQDLVGGEEYVFRVTLKIISDDFPIGVFNPGKLPLPIQSKDHTTMGILETHFSIDANMRKAIRIEGVKTLSQILNSDFPSAPNSACEKTLDILVDGELIIDVDYCFNKSSIRFNPGGILSINPGIDVNMDEMRLYPCSEMWAGVYLDPGALIRMTSSSVEDAVNGINLRLNSQALVYNSVFLNNDIAIHAPQANSYRSNISFYNSLIMGGGPGGLKNGGTSTGGIVSYRGIVQVGQFINPFPGEVFQASLIDGVGVGIVGINSTISINGCEIKNIHNLNGNSFDGHGVYSKGNGKLLQIYPSLPIQGFSNGLSISNVDDGIYIEGNTALINSASISNVKRGIAIYKASGLSYKIEDCNISADYFGIRDFFSNMSSGVIETNNIIITSTVGNGIDIIGKRSQGTSLQITDNLVNSSSDGSGIRLWASKGVLAENNQIDQGGDGSNAIGIELKSASDNVVGCNVVNGGAASTSGQGIYIENAARTSLTCNNVLGSAYGVQLVNSCLNSSIQGNDMNGNVARGLLYGRDYGGGAVASATTGPQLLRGNTWNSTDAWHFGSSLIERRASQFVINNTQQSQFAPTNLSTLVGNGWFVSDPSGTNYSCSTSGDCSSGIGLITTRDNEIDSLNLDIAQGDLTFDGFQEPRLWALRYQMYESFLNGVSTTGTDSILQQFEIDANQGNIGKLQQASDQAVWAIQSTLVDSIIVELIALTALDSLNITALLDSSILEFDSVDLQLQSIFEWSAQDSVLAENSYYVLDSLVSEKQTILLALTSANTSESALADVLDIALAYTQSSYDLDSLVQYKSVLQPIAAQCPLEYGPAVHWARALLAPIDTVRYTDDACATSALRSAEAVSTGPLHIVPNPNDGSFLVYYPVEIGNQALCRIVNTQGVVVQEMFIEAGLDYHYIQGRDLPSGTYFIQILKDDELQQSTFVVQH